MPAKLKSATPAASPSTRKSSRVSVVTPEPTDRVSRSRSIGHASPSPAKVARPKDKVQPELMSPPAERRGRGVEQKAAAVQKTPENTRPTRSASRSVESPSVAAPRSVKNETPKQKSTAKPKSRVRKEVEVQEAEVLAGEEEMEEEVNEVALDDPRPVESVEEVAELEEPIEGKRKGRAAKKEVITTPRRGRGKKEEDKSPAKGQGGKGSSRTPSPRKEKTTQESPILKEHAYVLGEDGHDGDLAEVVEEVIVKETATICGEDVEDKPDSGEQASVTSPKGRRSRARAEKVKVTPPPVSRPRRSRSGKGEEEGKAPDVKVTVSGKSEVKKAETKVDLVEPQKEVVKESKEVAVPARNNVDRQEKGNVEPLIGDKVENGDEQMEESNDVDEQLAVNKKEESVVPDEKVKNDIEMGKQPVEASKAKKADEVIASDLAETVEQGEVVKKDEVCREKGVDEEKTDGVVGAKDQPDAKLAEETNAGEVKGGEKGMEEPEVIESSSTVTRDEPKDDTDSREAKLSSTKTALKEAAKKQNAKRPRDDKPSKEAQQADVIDLEEYEKVRDAVITVEDSSSDSIQIVEASTTTSKACQEAVASDGVESMETDDVITLEDGVPTTSSDDVSMADSTQHITTPAAQQAVSSSQQAAEHPSITSSQQFAAEQQEAVSSTDQPSVPVQSTADTPNKDAARVNESSAKRKAEDVEDDSHGKEVAAKKQRRDNCETLDNGHDEKVTKELVNSYVVVEMSDVPPADSDEVLQVTSISLPVATNHHAYPTTSLFTRHHVDNKTVDATRVDQARAFSVVSYNILADHFLRLPTGATPDQTRAFDRAYRLTRIVEELRYLDGDIVCLQEVSPGAFSEHLQKDLRALGYQGHYRGRLGSDEGKEDGCATFYKTSRFTALESSWISLSESAEKEIDMSGLSKGDHDTVLEFLQQPDILMIDRLECKATGQTVTVGNIHVGWMEMDYPNIQSLQIACAFRELLSKAKNGQGAHLLMGDFNQTTTHPGYYLAKDGYLSNNMISYLQAYDNVVKGDGSKTCLINLLWKSFQHSSHSIKSAYLSVQESEPEYTVIPKDAAIDYIFYSSSTLLATRVLSMPDLTHEDNLQNDTPTLDHPSDHLSLKATFTFK